MSKLFFKVSWPKTVEKFRELQGIAKARGWRLTVQNISRTRGIPMFKFYVDHNDGSFIRSADSVDDVETYFARKGA